MWPRLSKDGFGHHSFSKTLDAYHGALRDASIYHKFEFFWRDYRMSTEQIEAIIITAALVGGPLLVLIAS